LLVFAQLAFGRTDDIASPFLFQIFDIVLAYHAAIHDPDPVGTAVNFFDVLYNLLHRLRIMAVAREHFISHWHPATANDKCDIHLLAVRPVIARVPPPRQFIPGRLPFEIRAGHVIQE